MNDARRANAPQAEADEPDRPPGDERGWYLYGVIRAGDVADPCPLLTAEADFDSAWHDSSPLETIEYGPLAAIVRSVPLSAFDPDVIRARADDAAWLETVVRSHNHVIAQIHERMPILPVRFGSVYAGRSDIHNALEYGHDALLRQLEQVVDCDEWAVHLYADQQAVTERVSTEHPSAQQLRQEIAAARPGRAYLLQRRLADELAGLTDQALTDVAQTAYDQLARHAVAVQISTPAGSDAAGRREILRAAFLVPGVEAGAFLSEVESLDESSEGAGCTCSGPWPPYSFVTLEEEPA